MSCNGGSSRVVLQQFQSDCSVLLATRSLFTRDVLQLQHNFHWICCSAWLSSQLRQCFFYCCRCCCCNYVHLAMNPSIWEHSFRSGIYMSQKRVYKMHRKIFNSKLSFWAADIICRSASLSPRLIPMAFKYCLFVFFAFNIYIIMCFPCICRFCDCSRCS